MVLLLYTWKKNEMCGDFNAEEEWWFYAYVFDVFSTSSHILWQHFRLYSTFSRESLKFTSAELDFSIWTIYVGKTLL